MFLFDKSGKTASVMYGAPPDLHQQAEKILDGLIKVATTTNKRNTKVIPAENVLLDEAGR